MVFNFLHISRSVSTSFIDNFKTKTPITSFPRFSILKIDGEIKKSIFKMSYIILPLTLVGLVANVDSFIETLDIFYLPPIAMAFYILSELSKNGGNLS